MATHERANDALEAGGVFAHAAPTVAVAHFHFEIVTVEHVMALLFRQLFPWGVKVEASLFGETFQQMLVVLGGGFTARPWFDGPFPQTLRRVRDDELRVNFQLKTDARALRACTVGSVEGEGSRLNLFQGESVTVRACAMLAEGLTTVRRIFRLIDKVGNDDAVGQAQSSFNGVSQTLLDGILDDQAVDDDFDGVLLLLGELDITVKLLHLPVNESAGEALGAQVTQFFDKLTLFTAHNGGKKLEAGALRVVEQRIDHLLWGLSRDERAAHGAVRNAVTGEEKTQIIVDFGDRSDGRARVAVRGFLVDGNSWREAFDFIHGRLVQELAGVGRQGLHVAALTFGEEGVECQGGLTRARKTGEHSDGVTREFKVHVLQVVFTRTLNGDFGVIGHVGKVGHHCSWRRFHGFPLAAGVEPLEHSGGCDLHILLGMLSLLGIFRIDRVLSLILHCHRTSLPSAFSFLSS